MQQFDNRRILAIKALLECCESKEIKTKKVIDFIDELVNTSPGNAYLLLENREQKNMLEKLSRDLDNIDPIYTTQY